MLSESAAGDTVIIGALISAVGGLAAFIRFLINRTLASADADSDRKQAEIDRLNVKAEGLQNRLDTANQSIGSEQAKSSRFERELMAKDAELENLRSRLALSADPVPDTPDWSTKP